MATFVNIIPGRLWQVTDLLPANELADIQAVDWLSLSTHTSDGQESWYRRQVAWDDPVCQRIGQYIDCQLPAINSAIGTDFKQSGGHFWIDSPGFTVSIHTDGHLPNAMQLYWIVPDETYGTGFYRAKTNDSLMYQFSSRPNSGYIMLNHFNSDGSQPLMWHAMLNPVPNGHIRVSSYWQFK